MSSVTSCFSKGFNIFSKVAWLVVIPLALDILSIFGRLSGLPANAVTFGVKFSFPVYLPSLSDVYNFPSSQGSVQIGSTPFSSSDVVSAFLFALLFTVLLAFLAGGYLGTIDAKRKETSHRPSFFSLCSMYFLRLFGYGLLWLMLALPAVLLILSNVPGLVIPYVLFIFVVNYFLFLTPFAIVVDGVSLEAGISKSVRIAKGSVWIVLPYAVIYAILTALVSVVIYLFMNAGVGGYLIDTILYAFVGTILVSSTLVLYSEASTLPATNLNAPISPSPNADPKDLKPIEDSGLEKADVHPQMLEVSKQPSKENLP
jgi:hypothetical protein